MHMYSAPTQHTRTHANPGPADDPATPSNFSPSPPARKVLAAPHRWEAKQTGGMWSWKRCSELTQQKLLVLPTSTESPDSTLEVGSQTNGQSVEGEQMLGAHNKIPRPPRPS